MKRVARMLRNHRELILNWFRAQGQLSSGVVEGFNTKAKTDYQKSLRVSDQPCPANRLVSHPWCFT